VTSQQTFCYWVGCYLNVHYCAVPVVANFLPITLSYM
jgi:hypothetical protein